MSHTNEGKAELEARKKAVRQAQNNEDTERMAVAERELKEYRIDYAEMEKVTKNYKIHYERSLFQLAATLAHELFHVLTGYWSGFTLEVTPPKYYGMYRYGLDGEAGEWWAHNHGFNGIVDLFWNNDVKNNDDPYPLDHENMSAGVPFLLQTRYNNDESPAGEEYTNFASLIKDFIKKGKFGNMVGLSFRH